MKKKYIQGENESKPIKILGKNSNKWYDKTEDFFFKKKKKEKRIYVHWSFGCMPSFQASLSLWYLTSVQAYWYWNLDLIYVNMLLRSVTV